MAYVVPSFANQVWNPSIACNTQGKITIAYYAAYWHQGASLDNSTSVLVATSSDGGISFSIHSDGAVAFNPTTWKYSDYIGVAYNNSTYWGVWPQAVGTGADIDGRYRTVTAVVENVDDSPQRNSVANYVSFDGTSNLNSPYATAALLPGRTHTIGTSPSVQYQGITYSFVRWKDETGAFIGNSTQASVQIESHRYRAVFSKYMVSVAVKNEFKEPNGAANNGGTVNIDAVDYVTDNLPGKQKTFSAPQGENHRFEAKDQSWGSYYRGFNSRLDKGGGWFKDGLPLTGGTQSLLSAVPVQAGTYLATYRNRYTVHINGSTPETGGTVTDITSPQNVWQYEGAVTAPSQITSGGRTFQFYGWSDGATANPNPNPPADNMTYTALYKGIHISNNASTWSNNSQRKFVQTLDGWMHMVYESTINGVSHVFYENKPPGGSWQIVPFSAAQLWLDIGGSGSSPSIDFLPNHPSLGNTVCIVWQENGYIDYKSYFYNTSYNCYYPGPGGTLVSGESAANPSVAGTTYGWFGVVWESKNSPNCLKYRIQLLGDPNSPIYSGTISGTNNYSSCPAVSATKSGQRRYNVAYQQLIPPPPGPPPVSIKSCSYGPTGIAMFGPTTISSSSMNQNSNVSIVSLPDGPRACWIADFSGTGDPMQTQAVMCNPWTYQNYYTYYYSCKSTSINKRNDETGFYFTFSAIFSTPGWNNYDFVVSGSNLSYYTNVNTNAQYVQLCNGPNSSNMFVTAYYPSTVPYYFQMSNSLGSAGLAKSSPISISNSRGVVIENARAGIYYSLGSITVDGNPVNFIQMKNDPGQVKLDSLSAGSPDSYTVDSVNTVLLSEPFEMKTDSKILFSDYAVIGDSLAAVNLLGNQGYASFKVDLIEAVTGKMIGTIRNTIFQPGNFPVNKLSAYSLKATGSSERKVQMKITLATNIDNPQLSLVNDYSDGNENGLNKSGAQSLTLQEVEVITDYTLGQNYPNPFNPTTAISYTIPSDGLVTLKVYDALGREVKTLVNEVEKIGRYEVRFDASRLASGVYFYRLVSGKYVSTKKMLLIK